MLGIVKPRSVLACAGDFRQPEAVISIDNAEAGEYFVFVDGGGPERWVSSGGPIALPADPQNFVANNDLRENCWGDGGRDAFDCYGRTNVSFGAQTVQLDSARGRSVRQMLADMPSTIG